VLIEAFENPNTLVTAKAHQYGLHARDQLGDLRIAPGKPLLVISGAQLRGVSSIPVIWD